MTEDMDYRAYERNKAKLTACAMSRKWNEVISMYQMDPRLQKVRITRAGDTALHMAVSDGKVMVVRKMVNIMQNEELKEVLQARNLGENTALHLAAAMGNEEMCFIIARLDHSLVDVRNAIGETPLFLAAVYGQKGAFLCLHYIRSLTYFESFALDYGNCRRNNGDTFLHCAIAGGYFDLALQIIHLYKELANWVNEDGLSPLHLLASKPSAFRSGCHLGLTETILYNCIYVTEPEVANKPLYMIEQQIEQIYRAPDAEDRHILRCPANYETVWDVFRLMKRMVYSVLCHRTVETPESQVVDEAGRADALFPANCRTCYDWIKFLYYILIFRVKTYRMKKEHKWSVEIVKELLRLSPSYRYEDGGSIPPDFLSEGGPDEFHPIKILTMDRAEEVEYDSQWKKEYGEENEYVNRWEKKKNKMEDEQQSNRWTTETPLLVATKNGVTGIIEKILELFPEAIHDENEEKKNVVLLAAQHKQPKVYELLLKEDIYIERLFRQVDKEGNSALHLAATLGDNKTSLVPGEAFQMQWELKWYKFVKDQMPPGFFSQYNKKFETPDEVFTRTHKELVKSGGEWLNKTSESCSVVAALIATVAFATSATIPGGVKEDSGSPTLEKQPAFDVFAISSLIALCCSIMAVVMFLSLLTSRFQEQDFYRDLPRKLLLGMTLLFMSISSMLVSFCAGHFFMLKHHLQHAAFPLYSVTCLCVTYFVLSQFPLYFDFLLATIRRVPPRGYKAA